MRFSEDYFYEKYRMLPKSIKRVIYSLDIHNIVKSITDKHSLHVDTAGILDDEIMYAIVGITKVSDFIRNLKVQLKLPDNEVNVIAKDVNEKIFLPIREALKNVANKSTQDIKPETIETIEDNNLHKKEVEIESKIDHAPLTESEEIKQQIVRQQIVKPAVSPPPNLPTGEPNGEARPPSGEKKPIHIDPYREPTE